MQSPKGMDVRPATDKVRQAVFNSLISRMDLDGARVLDGFCGTGSYGLEALSRGAVYTTFVDSSRTSLKICEDNIKMLGVQNVTRTILKDVFKLPVAEEPVDLVFLDPPYRKGLLLPAIDHVRAQGWANAETLFVLECEKELKIEGGESKAYGDVQVVFL